MPPAGDSANWKIRGLKAKGWKKTLHADRNEEKAAVAIFASDKMDFRTKRVKKRTKDIT